MKTPIPIGLLLALAMLGCADEPERATRTCTLIGCGLGLELSLVEPVWSPGLYEIELSWTDEERVAFTCSFEVVALIVDAEIPDGGQPMLQTVRVCEQTEGGQRSVDFDEGNGVFSSVQDAPTRLELSVRRDGSSIAERAIEPEYELYYPNGEHCAACRTATAEVRLD